MPRFTGEDFRSRFYYHLSELHEKVKPCENCEGQRLCNIAEEQAAKRKDSKVTRRPQYVNVPCKCYPVNKAELLEAAKVLVGTERQTTTKNQRLSESNSDVGGPRVARSSKKEPACPGKSSVNFDEVFAQARAQKCENQKLEKLREQTKKKSCQKEEMEKAREKQELEEDDMERQCQEKTKAKEKPKSKAPEKAKKKDCKTGEKKRESKTLKASESRDCFDPALQEVAGSRNIWENDTCDCVLRAMKEQDTSSLEDEDDEDEEQGKGKCKKPRKMICDKAQQLKDSQNLMASWSKRKCRWPLACRKLYELQPGEENLLWSAECQHAKKMKVEKSPVCCHVAELIPDSCCYQAPHLPQLYRIRNLGDCVEDLPLPCPRKIPKSIASKRPKIWFDLVAANRCSLGRLSIQFYAETCPSIVKKFIEAVQDDSCCRFRLTKIKEDIWIEGKLDLCACDDDIQTFPCTPIVLHDFNVLDLRQNSGILSIPARFLCLADACKSISFTISLNPLNILKGQRICIGQVCNLSILEKLKKLATKYGCFKYDIVVRDYGLVVSDKDDLRASRKEASLKKDQCKRLMRQHDKKKKKC